MTGAFALGKLTPGGHGVTAAGGTAFAAAHGVVDRVLDDAADVRAEAFVAGFAGLAGNQAAILVSDRLGFGHSGVVTMLVVLYSLNLVNVLFLRKYRPASEFDPQKP